MTFAEIAMLLNCASFRWRVIVMRRLEKKVEKERKTKRKKERKKKELKKKRTKTKKSQGTVS